MSPSPIRLQEETQLNHFTETDIRIFLAVYRVRKIGHQLNTSMQQSDTFVNQRLGVAVVTTFRQTMAQKHQTICYTMRG